ncbi:cytosine permease [Kordiimonas pumila]|uniref:Cytosine permease n=1 Tax=Kordiimonas pumila TaxID=2161677 RepID=A0ABV7D5G0_9PROT|nr:cytosine permease [Kordiimonas pumila]
MSKMEDILNDNALHTVPDAQTVSGWRIAVIIIGVAIGLPMMLTGAKLAYEMSGLSAFGAFFVGGLMLAILGGFTGIVGARQKLSTYVIIQQTFGTSGAVIINMLLAFTIFAWFSITAAVFGSALAGALGEIIQLKVSGVLLTFIGVVLMVLTSIFGFKALDKLSLAAVPVLMVFLGYLAVAGLRADNAPISTDFDIVTIGFGEGVSMVVGSFIVGIVIFPDFCRYARNQSDGIIAALVSMGIGMPVVLTLSAIPSLMVGETDIIKLLFALGAGAPILFLLVFATWTTNASNLYSGSLALAATFSSVKKWKLTILGGGVGLVLAISGIANKLTDFLLLLGVMIPPIASIYIIDHLVFKRNTSKYQSDFVQKKLNIQALISWGLGSLFAFMTSAEVLIFTSFPSLDSIVVSSLCFYVFTRITLYRQAALA